MIVSPGPGGPDHRRQRGPRLRDDRGAALPLALFIILILAALAVGLTEMTTAELDVQRLTRWDLQAQYLAQAGIEHQVYVLKGNKDAAAVGTVNYPPTPGGEFWYTVAVTCLPQHSAGDPAVSCTANRESRRWEVVATGEIHQPGGGPILQTRSIRAFVEIGYGGTGADLYRFPRRVTILRWEEVYP